MSDWTRLWPRLKVTTASEEAVEKLDDEAVSFERVTGDMFASKRDVGSRQDRDNQ